MPLSSRPGVMGILNVTPDSFSDGGRFLDVRAAIDHGVGLVRDGADVLDVGGESTRPGAQPVPSAEEIARIVPVVEGLSERLDVPISIDTQKASVAAAALAAGATIVNDVSAGRFDPDMLGLVADAGAGFVAMHMQGEPRTMQRSPRYDDVVDDVTAFLVERLDTARDAGVAAEGLMADPGFGFGKTLEHNLALLAGLDRIVARVGVPVLVGTSRKSFIGAVLGADVDDRDDGTLASVVWAFAKGAAMVRVHDVAGAARSARLFDVMDRARQDGMGPERPFRSETAA
ncbi:MAG TPA: dihydropteroate synthase [Acidimicrobiia bacterium]|nr:dihydropteroate synthase [Acidimicrobiia bacterium]